LDGLQGEVCSHLARALPPEPIRFQLSLAEQQLSGALIAAAPTGSAHPVRVRETVVPILTTLEELLGHLTPPSSCCASTGSRPPAPGRPGPCPPCRGPCSTCLAGTDRAAPDRRRSLWRWRIGSSPRTGSPLGFAR